VRHAWEVTSGPPARRRGERRGGHQ
jgi:hypothetical protein